MKKVVSHVRAEDIFESAPELLERYGIAFDDAELFLIRRRKTWIVWRSLSE